MPTDEPEAFDPAQQRLPLIARPTDGHKRLLVWRQTIRLFDKSHREEGPFNSAGYHDAILEPKTMDGKTPDVYGLSDTHYIVGDVSFSPHKDGVAQYENSQVPTATEQALAPTSTPRQKGGAPFLFTSSANEHEAGRVNVIHFGGTPSTSIARIDDPKLHATLAAWRGFAGSPPHYNMSAVPESDPAEVREALAGVVRWAAIQNRKVSAEEFTQKLLGDMYESFRESSVSRLRGTVTEALKGLASKYPDEIKYDRDTKSIEFAKDYWTARKGGLSQHIEEWTGRNVHTLEMFTDEVEPDSSSDDAEEQ